MAEPVAASAPAPTTGGLGLFARQSSGLVRDFSLADTAWYGVFSTGGAFGLVYLFPGPQFFSPGISIFLLLLLSLAFGVLVFFLYSALGSAMPRAGGDYLFESRALHPAVGFTVPWACQLCFWLAFPAAGAFVVTSFGLVPLAQKAGATGLETWLVGKNGTFVVSAVVVVACWLLTVYGLRFYRQLQRYVLVPGIVLGGIATIILELANFNTHFAAKFDAYNSAQHITTASVAAAAAKAGYHPPAFNLGHTLIWIAVLAGVIPYTMFAAQGLLGEVKGARNMWRLFGAFLFPGILVAIGLLMIPFVLLQHIAGSNFLNQFAWAYESGKIAPAYSPNASVFISMLSSGWVVTILIAIGFICGGFGIANVVFVNASRVMMAMGLDDSLPRFFSDVSERSHTPVKASTLWSVLALIVAAAFAYKPDWETTILIAGVITSALVVGVTCLAATVFPYHSKSIFRGSPAAKYNIGPLPLMTVVGALATVISAALIWTALTNSQLGLTSTGARLSIGGAFVIGIVVYVSMLLYRRSRGVDTSLVYRHVPPD
jgi:basic amino acid/polyamine antiporter, APA family